MDNKKRAPIDQLLKAGEEARQLLIKRGLASEDNLVMRTQKEHPGLILPGIPSYLPYKWTIKDCQRMMYDIFKMWKFENEKNGTSKDIENLAGFITFCVKEMNRMEDAAKKKMNAQKGLLKYIKNSTIIGKILDPINQHEKIRAINKFFVDSFAVGIIVNGEASTTSEYAIFFFDWTSKLYKIWEAKEKKN